MQKAKKILAPTDLSELSCAGVRFALESGAATGAEVIVYNVVGYAEISAYLGLEDSYLSDMKPIEEGVLDEHRKKLAYFLRKNFSELIPSVTIKQEVDFGTPYQKIVDKAASDKVDTIILSTHGRTGVVHAFLGSVAEKVVRLANCPVLTIHPSLKDMQAQAA